MDRQIRNMSPGEIMAFDSATLQKYRDMTDSEKIQALKQAIHLDEKPLGTLLAMLAILEPDRVESIFERLTDIKP